MYFLPIQHLNYEVRDRIVESSEDLFWTEDWSEEYYLRQSRLGFIATSTYYEGRYLLLPELQHDYAVLSWQNIRVDRGVRSAIQRLDTMKVPYRLVVENDPRVVLDELEKAWGKKSWIHPPYRQLLISLSNTTRRDRGMNIQILGVRLVLGESEQTIAGELGYLIGGVYTSLSGFFYRENKEWNNLGKTQLILLARFLQDRGVAFWNLGHPHMQYKKDLGALILERKTFLPQWDHRTSLDCPDLGI